MNSDSHFGLSDHLTVAANSLCPCTYDIINSLAFVRVSRSVRICCCCGPLNYTTSRAAHSLRLRYLDTPHRTTRYRCTRGTPCGGVRSAGNGAALGAGRLCLAFQVTALTLPAKWNWLIIWIVRLLLGPINARNQRRLESKYRIK